MPTAYVYTVPVAQANILGAILGTITIDPQGLTATMPYEQATGITTPVPGAAGTLIVQLTAADMTSILGTIMARAVANAQAPAGSITVQ